MITQEKSILANFFKEGNLKNKYKELLDITKVTDLDKTYLKELLKKIIIFKNQERKLADLIGIESKKLDNNELSKKEINILEKIMISKILSELILGKNIIVSNNASFTDSNSPYYDPYYIDIPRTFDHQIIDKNLLKNCKNVHWLKCIDNKFVVKYSNRLCNLRDSIKKEIRRFKKRIRL